jgi:hypothetical protein
MQLLYRKTGKISIKNVFLYVKIYIQQQKKHSNIKNMHTPRHSARIYIQKNFKYI